LAESCREASRHISILEVQSIAVFDDQIWVATAAGIVRRVGLDGRALDAQPLSLDPDGSLIPTTIGAPAALWTGRDPVLLLDDLGSLAHVPAPSGAVIPIAGRRMAQYAGSRVSLPSGASLALADGAQIAGGSAILDGSSLAIVAEHARGREIVVVALVSGRIVQRMALPAGTTRIGARRGLAVVQDDARRLAVFDLRFARSLGAVAIDDDIADFAIDPDGKLLAIRVATGEVELAPLGELTAGTVRVTAAYRSPGEQPPGETASPGSAAPSEPANPSAAVELPRSLTAGGNAVAGESPRVTSAPARDLGAAAPPAHRPLDAPLVVVDALEPRSPRPRLLRAEALAELDRAIRSVMLWTLRAIAQAWDTRRLAYGDEGRHPYEHEVAALVGDNAGFATDYVAAARDKLAEHEAALAADPRHRGEATPVAELAREFGLSAVAIDVLLVIAAPTLDGDVARLYGILDNDPGRSMVDELLVQHVLAGRVSRHDVAAELHPHAPLVRFGIVGSRTARPRPFAALEVDPVVLSRLRGDPPDLGAELTVRRADRDLSALDLAPAALASASSALAHAARPARVALRGRAGAGRRTLLAALADRAGRELGVIDALQLPRDPDRFVAALATALRRAQLAGLVPVVSGLDAVVFAERGGADLAREVLAAHPGPLALLSPPDLRAPLPIAHVVIDLPALSETERLAVWQRALAGGTQWLRDAAGLAARYRVGPGVMYRAVAATAGHDPVQPCDDRIDAFLRHSRDLRLADHARRVDRLATWADLVLPPDIMDSLREMVGRVRHRRTVFEDWGMGRAMATSRCLTALFQGQPGTGKTLVAGVVARELGLDLYQVDLSKVMSKWIGETERNLAKIFDAAEDGQVILLFDEADSLFARRTEVRSSNDRYANLEVNYLLQRLDSFEGIAILTTNIGGSIDPAFKRRMSFRLSFPFPDEETRTELWRVHLPRELPRAGELTFDVLARKYQLSGGYIRNACLRAAFLAAQEETALHQHHLERAVALEFAELGKLSTTGAIA
jgi:hypothetical protein